MQEIQVVAKTAYSMTCERERRYVVTVCLNLAITILAFSRGARPVQR